MRTALIACLFASTLSFAESPAPRFTDPSRRARLEAAFPEVEKVFERYQQERGIPGLVFGIVIDGEIALVRGLGVRDRSAQQPVTADTVFRIASMTKNFTALAILKLRDEGKLSLDDPTAKWIPELGRLNYPTRDTAPVRIRQLLTHGAGFPEDNPWGDQQLAAPEATLTRWLERGLPFSTPPDTAFEYSNYGFALLGRIVSKASGMPYREYIEKQILAPVSAAARHVAMNKIDKNVRIMRKAYINPTLGGADGFGPEPRRRDRLSVRESPDQAVWCAVMLHPLDYIAGVRQFAVQNGEDQITSRDAVERLAVGHTLFLAGDSQQERNELVRDGCKPGLLSSPAMAVTPHSRPPGVVCRE